MLYARLDKSGTRVLRGACRRDIARVWLVGADLGGINSPQRVRAVWFGPGWQRRSDGVRELTRHARLHARHRRVVGKVPLL